MKLIRVLHIAVLALVLLAAVALWSSIDRETGRTRFVLICLSAVVFLLISRGGRKGRRYACGFMASLGAALSVAYLFGRVVLPTFAKLGIGWAETGQTVRSSFEAGFPAGLIVLSLPFLVAKWLSPTRPAIFPPTIVRLIAIVLVISAVIVSGSVASMTTLLIGTAIAGGFLIFRKLKQASKASRRVTLAAGFLCLVGAAVSLLSIGGRPPSGILPPDLISGRIELAAQAGRLVGDFPIVGGGLGSIPGLYAHYIRGLPVYFVPHAENLLLNIGIELGLIGLLALSVTWAGSAILLLRCLQESSARSRSEATLVSATLVGLGAVLLLGSIDDPIYMSWAQPLLLVIPGLAVSFARESDVLATRVDAGPAGPKWLWFPTILLASALTGLLWRPLLATWHSNIGAVELARLQLADWPSGKWSDGSLAPRLAGAETRLLRAQLHWPEDRTALHRLGLIAMEHRDFAVAVGYLSEAYRLDPGHRGIKKALGYSLVWIGEYQQAAETLGVIREAQAELRIYERWWRAQGYPALSENSTEMLAYYQNF